MLTPKEVGKRAKAARKRAKLKQQDVADHFGIEKGTVSRWETGFTEIPLTVVIKLAHLYECSAYAILLDAPDSKTAAEQEQA